MQAARAASTLPAPSCPPQPLASTSTTPTSAVDRLRMWTLLWLRFHGSRPDLTPRTASALYAEHSVPAVAVEARREARAKATTWLGSVKTEGKPAWAAHANLEA